MFTSLFQLEQKPVTVFSSDDVGAPVLTKDAGSLKTLLKACLVTGYGDKTALGWQMLFESADTLSAAFASTDIKASKCVIKINNSTATSAKISAYQSMTDIDTGVKPIAVDNEYELYATKWKLIGHSRAFILVLNVPAWSGEIIAYPIIFGDLPTQVSRAQHCAVLWTARKANLHQGSVQTTLFRNPNGVLSEVGNMDPQYATCYPFRVQDGGGGYSLTDNYSKFSYSSQSKSLALYDYVMCGLPDNTWTFLPMVQCLSSRQNDIGNLRTINASGIKIRSGDYKNPLSNNDCVVPTDWWYV